MTTNFNIVRNGSIALIAFVLLALPFSAAHAADMDYYDSYDVYDYSQPDYSYDSYDVYDYSQPDYSYDVYDYSQPDYSNDYGYNDYGYGGSGFMGGSYLGGGFMGGSSYIPSRPTNSNTNINENYCTNGSCNTAINAPTTVTVTNPNNNYQQPVCQQGFYGTYPNCYRQTYTQQPVYQNPPIAYNRTPYVSLSAVPYTGLDLGFWGTIAYWGFLILWCLVAAYLIVVKKVQNRILRSLNSFLFGDGATSVSHTVAMAPAPAMPVPAPSMAQVDAIDDFIISQINRVRA